VLGADQIRDSLQSLVQFFRNSLDAKRTDGAHPNVQPGTMAVTMEGAAMSTTLSYSRARGKMNVDVTKESVFCTNFMRSGSGRGSSCCLCAFRLAASPIHGKLPLVRSTVLPDLPRPFSPVGLMAAAHLRRSA
jgi:hypothetical protein